MSLQLVLECKCVHGRLQYSGAGDKSQFIKFKMGNKAEQQEHMNTFLL